VSGISSSQRPENRRRKSGRGCGESPDAAPVYHTGHWLPVVPIAVLVCDPASRGFESTSCEDAFRSSSMLSRVAWRYTRGWGCYGVPTLYCVRNQPRLGPGKLSSFTAVHYTTMAVQISMCTGVY